MHILKLGKQSLSEDNQNKEQSSSENDETGTGEINLALYHLNIENENLFLRKPRLNF